MNVISKDLEGFRVYSSLIEPEGTARLLTVWIVRLEGNVEGETILNRAVPDSWPNQPSGLVQVYGLEWGFKYIRENLL